MSQPLSEWTNQELLSFLESQDISQFSIGWLKDFHKEIYIRIETIEDSLIELGVDQTVLSNEYKREILQKNVELLSVLESWYTRLN